MKRAIASHTLCAFLREQEQQQIRGAGSQQPWHAAGRRYGPIYSQCDTNAVATTTNVG